MNMRIINTSLSIFWFALFLGMVSRVLWMPPWLLARAETPQAPIITALLLMLSFWNFSKYWSSKRFAVPKSQIDPALKVKIKSITGDDPRVTDPQFAFDDQASTSKPS